MRVMPCQEIYDVIVCKFLIIFICGGVMRWNCIRDLLPRTEGVKLGEVSLGSERSFKKISP